MGFFKSWGSVIIYPITRSFSDVKSSAKAINESVKKAKEVRQTKAEINENVSDYLKGKTPSEKFEEVFILNEWTDKQLKDQKIASRNTRWGMLFLTALGTIFLGVLLFFVPWWVLAIMGPLTVIFFTSCMAIAARYAWWEAQIGSRQLFSFSTFLSRDDFFRKVFSL